MRKPHDEYRSAAERKFLLPLCWQYADKYTMDLFLKHMFLLETSIEEDYIAYEYLQGENRCVFLMFMVGTGKTPFSIKTKYACELIRKWRDAGYDAKILSQCIRVENKNNDGFCFGKHSSSGLGTFVYRLVENDGKPMLVFDTHACWPVYDEKLVRVARTQDVREYECLFEPNVVITTGAEKDIDACATMRKRKMLTVETPCGTVFFEGRPAKDRP